MTKIPVSQGLYAEVDDEIAPLLLGYKWYPSRATPTLCYAMSKVGKRTIYMHRLILGLSGRILTDHRDGNGLNNQLANLRRATSAQNNANRRKQSGKKSAFKGVTFDKWSGRWKAQIMQAKRNFHLGRFASEREAAEAYDEAALLHFGDFAKLNFPKL